MAFVFLGKARFPSACELASKIRRAEISAREVVGSHYAEIKRTNPSVNAMCTLVPEASALAQVHEKENEKAKEKKRKGEKKEKR